MSSGAIDIIIVNHNTHDELMACLASLHDAWPKNVREVVVVDNASTDSSLASVRERFPRVRAVSLDTNLGFGAANNVGIRQSAAEWVLLLNSDTVVPRGAIDTLFDRVVATGAVAGGPKLIDGDGRPEISFGPMLSPAAEAAQRFRVRLAARRGSLSRWYVERHVSRERSVDWVSGACLLVNRDRALAAGGFDERYFMYEEDVDLCAALRSRGGSILFTPSAHVVHLRGRAIRKLPLASTPSHYDRSHVAFYDKHLPGWAPWLRRWLRWRGRSVG